ncbi:TadE/TadG family type IV pilus assembly protein [Oceaniglobus indicus]|uniref:TadE/TadG family type IV pilus assembly protein n=1 Tax=Oceaniglobus indicus TaxID=2047749 RepID=UPI001303F9DD|nr:TadE/TadG family type IV pilus assembly protein [Oceaniglobus indicus]
MSFSDDESGSMIIFGLYLFMAILLIGGISVDVMRNEFERLKLQNTVDTAVLAAADLDQRLDPESVVRDHFSKAGLGEQLNTVSVSENINSRTVTATSSIDVNTLFINALGVSSLSAMSSGTAREDISDIEISLVLDISGSMGSYGRMANMQDAANHFIDTVLSDERSISSGGEVSLSIVPYSTQVNMGPDVLDEMNLWMRNPYSNCVDLESQDFDNTAVPTAWRRQTGHFDPFSRTSPPSSLVCRTDSGAQATTITENKSLLKSQINALSPGGNTSIDIGLKWGAALLDPSFRDIADEMIENDRIDDVFDGRPYDYNRPNSMKVLVVMTDGENTTQYTLNDAYNQGDSDVWGRQYSNGTWRYSVNAQEYRNQDRDSTWWEDWYLPRYDAWSNSRDGGDSDSNRLSYQELWANMSIGYNAYYNWYRQYNNANTYYDWYYAPYSTVSAQTKDNRMRQICAAAKDQGILVFSVAFEIDDDDAILLRECASSPNHYFDVDGSDIVYAFSAIASTINQLRLVQ